MSLVRDIVDEDLPMARQTVARDPGNWNGGQAGRGSRVVLSDQSRIINQVSGELETRHDRIVSVSTVTTVNDGQISVESDELQPEFISDFTLTSSEESIATVASSGFVSHQSDGECTILATAKGYSKRFNFVARTTVDESSPLWVAHVEGSFAKHASAEIYPLISGKDYLTVRDLYSVFPGNSSYDGTVDRRYIGERTSLHDETRGADDQVQLNPSRWCSSIDFSCVPIGPVYSGQTNIRRGPRMTAISKRHVVGVNHWYPPAGSRLAFVQSDGSIITRTISAVRTQFSPDLCVAILSEDLPETITPASVFPDIGTLQTYWTNFYGYGLETTATSFWDSNLANGYVPVVWIDQQAHANIHSFSTSAGSIFRLKQDLEDGFQNEDGKYYMTDSLLTNRVEFGGGVEYFDSGSPAFIVVNGIPVFIGPIAGGSFGGGSGPFLPVLNDLVQAQMDSLSDSLGIDRESLLQVNLSGFLTFTTEE